MQPASEAARLEEQLERGAVLTFESCPFALPGDADRDFLLAQRIRGPFHKNISYDAKRRTVGGVQLAQGDTDRLRNVLADFSAVALAWLRIALPHYADAWELDRVSFRPEEEATRRLRPTARNDLLHLDSFPTRPARGRRILRLFVNLHPTDNRVWATSETFERLLERYGTHVGLPAHSGTPWLRRVGRGMLDLFRPSTQRPSDYDSFMQRFHHFLKLHEPFQEGAAKKIWHFPPNSAWLLFTDAVSYAELRGRFALEVSLFVPTAAMVMPELAPQVILERRCRDRRAA